MLVRRALLPALMTVATVVTAVEIASVPAGAAITTFTAVSPTGSVTVYAKGTGHGRGMSQYGARGAAGLGRTYRQILSFYYPHATLTTLRPSWIRVKISGHGTAPEVAAEGRLTVSGVKGYLPTTGVRRYRLVADAATGLTLQQLRSTAGATWRDYRPGLRDGAWFYRGAHYVTRLYSPTGASNYYYGTLRAYRVNPTGAGGGVRIVNTLTLDAYTAGVAAREMPAAWAHAATQAQAVAARTYGRYAIVHPSTAQWDICDTNHCQVYKGHLVLDARGVLIGRDNPDAVRGDWNQVLYFQGLPIFAQFDGSNGGWIVDGNKPYLSAHADPYDTSRSARNPWTLYTMKPATPSVARYFGLAELTGIAITQRDGHGTWGGRVLTAQVRGVTAAGQTVVVSTTGAGLSAAFGMHTSWLQVVA
ncbi:MAG TPA: SpoIID/LytB domain-containing protein [Jatrophihabitans sp.]|uniref:SpoIID/LytB domain-containing protein n=1 Tax=Jatrophihabitans sp. TaxID=1932789 RepID=UPI002E025D1F|nr:SpoIID/LytB domain-containing protein [Jatrophihabitans sp.]